MASDEPKRRRTRRPARTARARSRPRPRVTASAMITTSWIATAKRSFDLDGFLARFPSVEPKVVSYTDEDGELGLAANESGFECEIGRSDDPEEIALLALHWVKRHLTEMRA